MKKVLSSLPLSLIMIGGITGIASQLSAQGEPQFKLTNKQAPAEIVIITKEGEVQPPRVLATKGSVVLMEVPQGVHILPKIKGGKWRSFTFEPARGQRVYVAITRLRAGNAALEPDKIQNNIAADKIKIKENAPPPKPGAPVTPVVPVTKPEAIPPAIPRELTKEQWLKIGLEKGWIQSITEVPKLTDEDLQKKLHKEALDKLIEKIRKEAKLSAKKLPIIEDAIKAFWEDAGRGQKTSMKLLPPYIFKALEEGDNAATISGMLGLWMGMPERARDAWRGEKPEKIGAFLKERYTLSRLLVIPTKPETPEKIKPEPAKPKEIRPLKEQAKEWSEQKLNMEIGKKRMALRPGPFAEKDPKKIKTLEDEIELLEKILEERKK